MRVIKHNSGTSGPTRAGPTAGDRGLRIVRDAPKRRSPHVVLALLVVLFGLTAAIALRERVPGVAPRACATAAVTHGPISGTLKAAGRLMPKSSVRIGAEMPGRVVAMNVGPGDRVARGQVLARLDDAEQRAAVDTAGAQVMTAGLHGLRAERELEDMLHSLRERGGLPPALVPDELLDGPAGDVQLELLAATAHTAKQQAALALARTQLARRVIRSPVDGVVLSASVGLGELVPAGPSARPLFVIDADPAALRLEAEVDERHVAGIGPGHTTFTTPVHGGYQFTAEVRNVDLPDGGLRSPSRYLAVLDVSRVDGALKPGMSATVDLPVEGTTAFQVPRSAVTNGRIWLADASGALRQVPIEVGVSNKESVEIRGPGVEPGATLVSDASPLTCVVGR